uniref:Chromosome 15 open reading frame 40 n=1 Tax=Sciurus vulgaris TaxID=55149 RepID=A0A8D2B7C4_SCIVU
MVRLGGCFRHLSAGLGTQAFSGVEMPKKASATNKGGKSREKVVKLLASTTAEEILEKLKKEAKKK